MTPDTAVILAGGRGRRIRDVTKKPKVIIETDVYGFSVLERHLKGLSRQGVERFVIVVGYKADEVINYVKSKGLDKIYEIYFAKTDNYDKYGNGYGALSAEKYVDRPFLLVMGDHIIDYSFLGFFHGRVSKNRPLIDFIDTIINYVKPEWCTKVRISNGYVTASSKNLEKFDGVDIGCFLCHPSVFAILKRLAKEGKTEWNDLVEYVIERYGLPYFDIKGKFWHGINNKEQYESAKKSIIDSLRHPEEGPVTYFFNRRISMAISKKIAHYPVTPNMVTFLVLLFSAVPAFLASVGTKLGFILSSITIQLYSILEGCDGEIARLKLMESNWGRFFDGIADRIAEVLIFSGLILGIWRYTGNFNLVYLCMLTWAAISLTHAGGALSFFLVPHAELKPTYRKFKFKLRKLSTRDMQLFYVSLGVFLLAFSEFWFSFVFSLTAILLFSYTFLKILLYWKKYGKQKTR